MSRARKPRPQSPDADSDATRSGPDAGKRPRTKALAGSPGSNGQTIQRKAAPGPDNELARAGTGHQGQGAGRNATLSDGGTIFRMAVAGPETETPGAMFDQAMRGSTNLPYRSEMEQAFGQDFSNVQAFTGKKAEMDSLGAEAATREQTTVFGSASPSKEVVAHELTHVVQNRQAGTAPAAVHGKSEIAPAGSDAENEADTVAAQAAKGEAVSVHAAPGEGVARKLSLPDTEDQVRIISVNLYLDAPCRAGDLMVSALRGSDDGSRRYLTLKLPDNLAGEFRVTWINRDVLKAGTVVAGDLLRDAQFAQSGAGYRVGDLFEIQPAPAPEEELQAQEEEEEQLEEQQVQPEQQPLALVVNNDAGTFGLREAQALLAKQNKTLEERLGTEQTRKRDLILASSKFKRFFMRLGSLNFAPTERQETEEELSEAQQTHAELSAEVQAKTARLSSVEDRLQAIDGELGGLETQRDTALGQLGGKEEELHVVDELVAGFVPARSRLGEELSAARDEAAQAVVRGKIKALEDEHRKNVGTRVRLNAEVRRLRARIVELDRRILGLEQELGVLQGTQETLVSRLQVLSREVASAQSDVESAQGELAEIDGFVASYQERRDQDKPNVDKGLDNLQEELAEGSFSVKQFTYEKLRDFLANRIADESQPFSMGLKLAVSGGYGTGGHPWFSAGVKLTLGVSGSVSVSDDRLFRAGLSIKLSLDGNVNLGIFAAKLGGGLSYSFGGTFKNFEHFRLRLYAKIVQTHQDAVAALIEAAHEAHDLSPQDQAGIVDAMGMPQAEVGGGAAIRRKKKKGQRLELARDANAELSRSYDEYTRMQQAYYEILALPLEERTVEQNQLIDTQDERAYPKRLEALAKSIRSIERKIRGSEEAVTAHKVAIDGSGGASILPNLPGGALLSAGVTGSASRVVFHRSKLGENGRVTKQRKVGTVKEGAFSLGTNLGVTGLSLSAGIDVKTSEIKNDNNPDNDGLYLNTKVTLSSQPWLVETFIMALQGGSAESITPVSGDPRETAGRFEEHFKKIWEAAKGAKPEESSSSIFSNSRSVSFEWNCVDDNGWKLQYFRISETKTRGLSSGDIPVGMGFTVGVEGGTETSQTLWELAGTETATYFSTVYNGFMKRGVVGKEQWADYCKSNRGQMSKFFLKAAAGKVNDFPGGAQGELAGILGDEQSLKAKLLGKLPDSEYYRSLVVFERYLAEKSRAVAQQSEEAWQTYDQGTQKVSGKLTVTDEGELLVRDATLHTSGLSFNRSLTKHRSSPTVVRTFADFYHNGWYALDLDLKVKWKDERNRSHSKTVDFKLVHPEGQQAFIGAMRESFRQNPGWESYPAGVRALVARSGIDNIEDNAFQDAVDSYLAVLFQEVLGATVIVETEYDPRAGEA